MKQIIIKGQLCELYRMMYFLMYAQNPDKNASVINHIGDIISIPGIIFSGILYSYMFFISSLNEQTNEKRIAEMLHSKNEIGTISVACWLILNTIIIRYVLINYTLPVITFISIICVIILLSKINVKIECNAKY